MSVFNCYKRKLDRKRLDDKIIQKRIKQMKDMLSENKKHDSENDRCTKQYCPQIIKIVYHEKNFMDLYFKEFLNDAAKL